MTEAQRNYYIKNKDRIISRQKTYYVKNREKVLEYAKKYQKENKKKLRLSQRIYMREYFRKHYSLLGDRAKQKRRTPREIKHPREVLFYKMMLNQGVKLSYEPKTFHVKMWRKVRKYTPDFYDSTTDTFYEVVGTRQALSHSKTKLLRFVEQYPLVKFKLMVLKKETRFEELFFTKGKT